MSCRVVPLQPAPVTKLYCNCTSTLLLLGGALGERTTKVPPPRAWPQWVLMRYDSNCSFPRGPTPSQQVAPPPLLPVPPMPSSGLACAWLAPSWLCAPTLARCFLFLFLFFVINGLRLFDYFLARVLLVAPHSPPPLLPPKGAQLGQSRYGVHCHPQPRHRVRRVYSVPGLTC